MIIIESIDTFLLFFFAAGIKKHFLTLFELFEISYVRN